MVKAKKPESGSTIDPKRLATLARLRYVCDSSPGFSRRRKGSSFIIFDPRGKRLRDPSQIERIEKLAIPPAWKNVWIARQANAHLQATGKDDRGRKQYLYHERWREISNLAKFWRLAQFGTYLPRLRREIRRQLRCRNLRRERVLAGVVGILDQTSLRVGHEEYASANSSYGLTTLRMRHVSMDGRTARLHFRGKANIEREVMIADPALVTVLNQCRCLPGSHVFQYMNGDAGPHAVTAAEVNEYLHMVTGQPFTAKDFRTWKASSHITAALLRQPEPATLTERKRVLKTAIAEAAELLGNTPTVCAKYYVHPALAEKYLQGEFAELLAGFRSRRSKWLQADEQAFAYFLKRWAESSSTA